MSKEVLNFYASWYGPCKVLNRELADQGVTTRFEDVNWKYVDVDEDTEFADKHKVCGLPTLVFLHDGNQVARVFGYNLEKVNDALQLLHAA